MKWDDYAIRDLTIRYRRIVSASDSKSSLKLYRVGKMTDDEAMIDHAIEMAKDNREHYE